MTIDTADDKFIIQRDSAPDKPSENMLRAIHEDGFLSLHEVPLSRPANMVFGNLSQRTLSQLFVPVRSEARTVGVLSIQSYQRHAYTEASLETLKTLANHCAGALERIWAQEAATLLAERLKALYHVTHAISASLDMDQLCDAIHNAVESVMPCDDFVIDGYDPETNKIVPIYAIEYPQTRVVTDAYIADHGLAGSIVHTRESILLNSKEEMAASGIKFEIYGSNTEDPTQSILAAPMILQGAVAGMISAQAHKENAYTRDDLYLLELLASHAAIAIENSRLFATIERLANIDPLTGALTRRKFFELSEREFNRAKRYKTPLSILMLDIDEFKRFNDRFGHQTGDLVLKLISSYCKASLRNVDIFGRLGGEEFAATLPDTTLEQAAQVAGRLCTLIEEANLEEAGVLFEMSTGRQAKKDALKVTVSVGVAACDDSCRNVDVLLDHADRAMYAVKYTGRNRISVWK
ncbi:MAG: sensor domain-containing diguanylate cyclase [Anaerolineales bacterium]|nr:sensor domain-containing diguanylate cyclase [Anaerolineales bacterium]